MTAERADTGVELAELAAAELAGEGAPAPETAELPDTGLLPLMFTDEMFTCLDTFEPTALLAGARLLA